MIKYSFMKCGIYNDLLGILAYFNKIKFHVGGYLFSFHDLESGILRGNRNAPYSPFPQIKKEDPRMALVLKDTDVDCRIHFGLNCGATSCPPVKWYTSEGIYEELRIVAQAFMEDDTNCTINEKNHSITISEILNWYLIDFAKSKHDLPQKILEFLHGDKKTKLQEMLNKKGRVKVYFHKYDWTTNATKNFVPFKTSNLKVDVFSLWAVC